MDARKKYLPATIHIAFQKGYFEDLQTEYQRQLSYRKFEFQSKASGKYLKASQLIVSAEAFIILCELLKYPRPNLSLLETSLKLFNLPYLSIQVNIR